MDHRWVIYWGRPEAGSGWASVVRRGCGRSSMTLSKRCEIEQNQTCVCGLCIPCSWQGQETESNYFLLSFLSLLGDSSSSSNLWFGGSEKIWTRASSLGRAPEVSMQQILMINQLFGWPVWEEHRKHSELLPQPRDWWVSHLKPSTETINETY